MTSRGKSDGCRICGGDLQGNQRKWLFGGQNKRGEQPQTPTDSLRKGSLSMLAQGSPWGSTLSLGSSLSLSKSLSVLSPSKGIDLLPVLTHIIGQSVPRGNGQGEFLCGKCVSVLERVFKFDTVIARVKVLSAERLQKLTQERDKVRQWVRAVYRQRQPSDFRMSSSEDDGELGGGEKGRSVGEGYREILRDNMALSEFECWSEKSDSCPYFRRTGKRCNRGKNCNGCDSLRVSDSDYESVCGIPRHLPIQPFSPLGLSRDKSRSMPLHWPRAPSHSCSSASSVGSCLSLRGPSRTMSIQSLDSLDGHDPFDWPEEPSVGLGTILKELKDIEGKPVSSPAGSRIPVLGRKDGPSSDAGETSKTELVRELEFGEGDDDVDGESEDVLAELRDEFLPLHREVTTGKVHIAVRQLREQLNQAQARIRTLEAEIKDGTKPAVNHSSGPNLPVTSPQTHTEDESELMQSVSRALRSRERVVKECVAVIRKLCVEAGPGAQEAGTLMDRLTAPPSAMESALEERLSELRERERGMEREMERGMEREMEALRQAGRERERDLNMLNIVLQCNQDVINELRVELGERGRVHREVQREGEMWRDHDRALTAALQEKESFILRLKEALESSQRDVQALSDSVIGQGVSGGGAEAALANQLREKEALLAAWLKDREEHSATVWQEVTKLTTALTDTQTMVQDQRDGHKQAIAALSQQLRDSQEEQRERAKEHREAERAWKSENEERVMEEKKLRDGLEKRDDLIEQVLLDSEERDVMLTEFQQNILSKLEPWTALKHTL